MRTIKRTRIDGINELELFKTEGTNLTLNERTFLACTQQANTVRGNLLKITTIDSINGPDT